MYEDVGSRELESTLLENAGDAEHVITPLPLTAYLKIEIEIEVAGKFGRPDQELTIGSPADTHMGRESNRSRHHESVVVIGVLSDEIYAARRTEYPRRLLENRFEALYKFRRIHLL